MGSLSPTGGAETKVQDKEYPCPILRHRRGPGGQGQLQLTISKALGFPSLPSCPPGIWVPPLASAAQEPKNPNFQAPLATSVVGPGFFTPQTPKPPPESGGTWLKWGPRGVGSQEGEEQPSAQN